MTARRIIVPGAMPSRDQNGRSLPALLRFYEPTATYDAPKPVYTSDDLDVAHAFPIVSDAAGRFPAIWGDDAETWDVMWSDQAFDRTIDTYADVSPLSDATLASAALAEAAADAAEAFAILAEEVAEDFGDVDAAITAAQAAQTAAESAQTAAEVAETAAAAAAAAAAASADSIDPSAINARLDALDLGVRRRKLMYGDIV